jgi:hypothetical protein
MAKDKPALFTFVGANDKKLFEISPFTNEHGSGLEFRPADNPEGGLVRIFNGSSMTVFYSVKPGGGDGEAASVTAFCGPVEEVGAFPLGRPEIPVGGPLPLPPGIEMPGQADAPQVEAPLPTESEKPVSSAPDALVCFNPRGLKK